MGLTGKTYADLITAKNTSLSNLINGKKRKKKSKGRKK